MRHLIKKQIIELTVSKRLNHFQIQQRLSDHYWKELVPLLEKAFDAMGSGDELIEIDHIELDFGVVSEKEIQNEDWNRVIEKKIMEKMQDITDPASAHYAIRSRDRRLGVFRQWLYYMQHGFLMWNTAKPDEKWYQEVLEAIAADISAYSLLQDAANQNPQLIKRIIACHHDAFLEQLTVILTAKKQTDLGSTINELLLLHQQVKLEDPSKSNLTDRAFKNSCWTMVLNIALLKAGKPISDLSNTLIENFIRTYTFQKPVAEYLSDKTALIRDRIVLYSVDLENSRQTAFTRGEDLVRQVTDKSQVGEYNASKQESLVNNHLQKIDKEGIFIVHAGAVLLHPFLKSLFKRLDLVLGNAFVNDGAQRLAIGLIHYMVTGRTEGDEFELTLSKVLCGFNLEEPMEFPASIQSSCLSECDALLEAAIAQWTILQNTSVSGLRESFLQRSGKLSEKNGSLYLQVEKQSFDMILDFLPWNLGIIKLPWMKDVLRVEWR